MYFFLLEYAVSFLQKLQSQLEFSEPETWNAVMDIYNDFCETIEQFSSSKKTDELASKMYKQVRMFSLICICV